MITQTISRQRIGGAMRKRDQAEWMTDGRLSGEELSVFSDLSSIQ